MAIFCISYADSAKLTIQNMTDDITKSLRPLSTILIYNIKLIGRTQLEKMAKQGSKIPYFGFLLHKSC